MTDLFIGFRPWRNPHETVARQWWDSLPGMIHTTVGAGMSHVLSVNRPCF